MLIEATQAFTPQIRVFSTSPQSRDVERSQYLQRVRDAARWSEAAGCEGILIYTDNGIADPWLVAQVVIDATEQLCPLVAVQPAYMHPYAVAKMVATLAHLHGRRVYLNIVAGGFRGDLLALGDDTPHDERYERAIEYGLIVKWLVGSSDPVSFAGRRYEVRNLRMTPPVPRECVPGLMISGSSPAGIDAARKLDAIAVRYPQPPDTEEPVQDGLEAGIRVGVIARPDREEAWRVAYERFPPDRAGQIAHRLAMRASDSVWHRQLSELARQAASAESPYWLAPFESYKTFCPYLVGSYKDVAGELERYMGQRCRTFVLDIPPSEEELHHTAVAFRDAMPVTPS
jgi:alkanesulfonate monooxygenase